VVNHHRSCSIWDMIVVIYGHAFGNKGCGVPEPVGAVPLVGGAIGGGGVAGGTMIPEILSKRQYWMSILKYILLQTCLTRALSRLNVCFVRWLRSLYFSIWYS
jgi:hypothetical protein